MPKTWLAPLPYNKITPRTLSPSSSRCVKRGAERLKRFSRLSRAQSALRGERDFHSLPVSH